MPRNGASQSGCVGGARNRQPPVVAASTAAAGVSRDDREMWDTYGVGDAHPCTQEAPVAVTVQCNRWRKNTTERTHNRSAPCFHHLTWNGVTH